jgi:hypothetical protein
VSLRSNKIGDHGEALPAKMHHPPRGTTRPSWRRTFYSTECLPGLILDLSECYGRDVDTNRLVRIENLDSAGSSFDD